MLQLYTVQCGLDVDVTALVQAQCNAAPLDCSVPAPIAAGMSISDVIAAALAGIEIVSAVGALVAGFLKFCSLLNHMGAFSL